jgi:repressor of nif and glnA expression
MEEKVKGGKEDSWNKKIREEKEKWEEEKWEALGEIFNPIGFRILRVLKDESPLIDKEIQEELSKNGFDLPIELIRFYISELLHCNLIKIQWKLTQNNQAVAAYSLTERLKKALNEAKEMIGELEK